MDDHKVGMILQLLLTICFFYDKPRNNVCQGLLKTKYASLVRSCVQSTKEEKDVLYIYQQKAAASRSASFVLFLRHVVGYNLQGLGAIHRIVIMDVMRVRRTQN